MSHRFLLSTDAKLICEFNQKYFPDGWGLKQIESAFNTDGFFAIGLFNGEELVGYIAYSVCLEVADLLDIVIAPTNRGQGYGKNLLTLSQNHIKSLGVERFILEVRQSNQTAINLYKSLGFNQISQRQKYYADGETAIVFQKEFL